MANIYVVVVSEEQLRQASDMLRYDGCYRAERTAGGWRLFLTGWTPARWRSYCVGLIDATPQKVPLREHNGCILEAIGFSAGLRLAHQLGGPRLVEGD